MKPFNYLLIFILFFSCDNINNPCGRKGTIRDYLGQDGCSLVIEDNDGDFYVPTNINEFGLFFYDGQKIRYSFRLDGNTTSSCNWGIPVTLMCVEQLD